ncbi:hypothetical protein F4V57_11610 [Acinetobacter qingfengensis]|uniref:Uncharacterized protein n=1 Tax=Acinetobacter qingfengensis TaxID=1262585 RepID=A0A1E7RFF7_9GAMM|nr:hypothetical protein [Acinetobacter qingfengensis]KAA8731884.1 hypothetical protein F4V57_11610 [Acinetobacter qingfengensis]OEY97992.1 hypothetical protein BJI46_00215 [Acinetobacter qingfengensis]
MSAHRVKLPVQAETYQSLLQITQALNAGEKNSLSKSLGEVLTKLTCEILDQVFADLIRAQAQLASSKSTGESQQVLDQISQQLQKYMPMSIGIFANERLKPVANYLLAQFDTENSEQAYLCYEVSDALVEQSKTHYQQLMQGDQHVIDGVFTDLVQIIDQGVSALIRAPKAMLKFNLVLDKTLNSVINVTTNIGYKRIGKIGKSLQLTQAQDYAKHFNHFLRIEESSSS